MQKTIYTPAYREMIGRLRAKRVALGMSQREVARRLNMQRSFITRIEMSECRVDCCQLVRFCRLYGLRASKLVRQLEGEMSEGDDPLYLSATVFMLCANGAYAWANTVPLDPSIQVRPPVEVWLSRQVGDVASMQKPGQGLA
jgi:transcriptional regulator with XRE-family HTH domain